MPHILFLLLAFAFELSSGPALYYLFRRSCYDERPGWDILRDRRARADISALANGDRGDKLGIAPDERAVLYSRNRLVRAVVVAGDGASPDVDALSYDRIAQIGEVVGLAAFSKRAFLHFHKIANPSLIGKNGLGPLPR